MRYTSFNKWIGLFLILLFPGIIYFYLSKANNHFIPLSIIGNDEHYIPDFAFINQHEDTITSHDFIGKIYVANFIFTSCPTICPTMTYNMKYVQNELSVYPNVRFLSHTVDPETDTPERLLNYAKQMKVDLFNWDFVTGEKEKIYMIAKSYFVNVSMDSLAPGGFLHSEYLVLVDKEGRVRSGTDKSGNVVGVYDGTKEPETKDLVNDIKVLMAEYKLSKKE